ncbi:protein HGV2 isoform X2 [Cylas formicarius]|nr:protein HGV2 isoform X2 [Cylas formicarius]XP_060521708.1 protein HGV2 isoform X2 [Cylas formicarius]XP_060521709.1 protein HGV2 isoform X2 [Cylas formicarius]
MADVIVDSESTDSKELLAQGIRAFYLQDYEAAVVALSRASELMVAEHSNDQHEELAEVYTYYGKSLLGLSRQQNEALGDAVPRNVEESDEDEGKASSAEDEDEEASKEGEAAKQEEKEEESSNERNGTGDEASTSKGDSTDDGKGDDEPTDLQVAWEVLELARKIYQRQGESSSKNLADTLVVLGEVSLESEIYDSAINDMKQGLEIQKQLFGDDSRVVAETYYKLGVAYSTNTQFDEAIESFQNSLQYLRNRISSLQKVKPNTDAQKEEVEEIEGLIPDIEEKVADMKNCKDEAIKKISEAVREVTRSAAPAGQASATSRPASDISHLVKRKRKAEDDPEDQTAAKQPSMS